MTTATMEIKVKKCREGGRFKRHNAGESKNDASVRTVQIKKKSTVRRQTGIIRR